MHIALTFWSLPRPGRYGMSTAQLELRWETQRGVVPVTATCTKDHAAPWRQDLWSPITRESFFFGGYSVVQGRGMHNIHMPFIS